MTVACDFTWSPKLTANPANYKSEEFDEFKNQSDLLTEDTDLISIKNYDLGINFLQQEFTNINQSTSKAIVRGSKVTLSRGKWPSHCENGRISFDSGNKFFYIASRDSDYCLTLDKKADDGMFLYLIRLTEFDLGEVKLCANRDENLIGNGENVINEFVSICESTPTNISSWSCITSASVSDMNNFQSIYYWLVFNSVSNFIEKPEVKVFNLTGNFWRKIARKRGGIWEYNNAMEATSETWVVASINGLLHSVSEALSSQPANRMTGIDLSLINEKQWRSDNNWNSEVDSISRGLSLFSNNLDQNPCVSQFTLRYKNKLKSFV